MTDLMFKVPSCKEIKKVIITEKTILEGIEPQVIVEPAAKAVKEAKPVLKQKDESSDTNKKSRVC